MVSNIIYISLPLALATAQPAPHADKLRPSAFTVRLAASHSPSLSLGIHHQSRFKRLNFKVLANGIFFIVLDVLFGHNNSQ